MTVSPCGSPVPATGADSTLAGWAIDIPASLPNQPMDPSR